jgi:hypothetical protein
VNPLGGAPWTGCPSGAIWWPSTRQTHDPHLLGRTRATTATPTMAFTLAISAKQERAVPWARHMDDDRSSALRRARRSLGPGEISSPSSGGPCCRASSDPQVRSMVMGTIASPGASDSDGVFSKAGEVQRALAPRVTRGAFPPRLKVGVWQGDGRSLPSPVPMASSLQPGMRIADMASISAVARGAGPRHEH